MPFSRTVATMGLAIGLAYKGGLKNRHTNFPTGCGLLILCKLVEAN